MEDAATQRLITARDRHRAAQQQEAKSLAEYHAAITDAANAGMKQVDIVTITGFTREHIRKVRKTVNEAREIDSSVTSRRSAPRAR